jgi:potassium efflux system protein
MLREQTMRRLVGHGQCGLAVAALAFSALGSIPTAFAAPQTTSPATRSIVDASLTLAEVQALRDAAAATELPEPARQELVKLYDSALDSLRQSAAFAEDESRYQRETQSAPAELEAARAETIPAETAIDVPSAAALGDLRTLREQAEANLKLAQQRVADLDSDLARRTGRRTEIPDQLARAQQDLDQANQSLAALDAQPPSSGADPRSAGHRVDLRARIARLQQFVSTLKAELASYDARRELNQVLRDRAAARVAVLETQVRAWREVVSRREQQQAAEEAVAARLAAAKAHPVVKHIADENVRLLEQLSGAPGEGPGLLERKAAAHEQLDALTRELMQLRDRLAREIRVGQSAILPGGIDARLRRIRRDLPDLATLQTRLDEHRAQYASTQQDLADVEYERDQLPTAEVQRARALSQLDPTLPQEFRDEIARELDRQIDRQRSLYDSLINEYGDCADSLLRLEDIDEALLATAGKFHEFIDERILWIRSLPPINVRALPGLWRDLVAVFDPSLWLELAQQLVVDAQLHPDVFGGWIAVFIAMLVLRRRLTLRLRDIAARVRNVSDDRFSYTVAALLITAVQAAFWPAVMWFVAWRIGGFGQDPSGSRAIAAGLVRAGVVMLVLQFYRHLCKNGGLGDAHFNWRESFRRTVRNNLAWLIVVAVPLSFTIAASESLAEDPGSSRAGRLAFLAAMLASALFVWRVLRPGSGILDGVLNRARNGWMWQLRYVWYAAGIALPLYIGVMAAIGYYYGSLQVQRRLIITVWLILALIVFNGLALRWLVIVRRSLAMEQARKRSAAASPEPGAATGAAADAPLVLDEPKVNINAISTQTRQLLRAAVVFGLLIGAWLIWVDMLPALAVLKRVEIWPEFRTREAIVDVVPAYSPSSHATPLESARPGSEPSGSAPTATAAEPSIPSPGSAAGAATESATIASDPASPTTPDASRNIVTLSDLVYFLVIVIATVLIARNIPGLLEITLLQWFTMEPSARYATATVARYLIVLVGVLLAFGAVGIGWNKVQWLAAAITLGVGFGLQEIFANFISGLILLFEQPIRVGDTVTVNNVDGIVTRIRMRATTITDYDRKEMIIPNKAFITGQIINWTLSDSTTRLTFPIGVAYGSDTSLVEQTLMHIARSSPHVVADPPPQVVFTGFGDSTLNFSLRVFLPNLDSVLAARHEINTAIDQAFREKHIEIAFPQRDIHIRSLPPRRQ